MCTVDYVQKSNTKESTATNKRLVDLQIYKMKARLLCEDVFVSYDTSTNDPISERDATSKPYTFQDCSDNTEDLIAIEVKQSRITVFKRNNKNQLFIYKFIIMKESKS